MVLTCRTTTIRTNKVNNTNNYIYVYNKNIYSERALQTY